MRRFDLICFTAPEGRIIKNVLMGLLNGRNAVCYPGYENRLTGATIADAPVVTDGRFITAKGAGVSAEFAFELVRILKGEETAKEIQQKISSVILPIAIFIITDPKISPIIKRKTWLPFLVVCRVSLIY